MTIAKSVAAGFLLLVMSASASPSQDWDKTAFVAISKTPNALTWSAWMKLEDFEKQALYETRYVKRTDPSLAFTISHAPNGIIISVDEADYYKDRRIIPSINIPFSKFSREFVRNNLMFFKKFSYIILYCR